MLVSVSFLKNKNGNKKTIEDINKSKADFIHVDVMDGIFVDNKKNEYNEIKDLFTNVDKPLDIHLMVDKPLNEIKKFINLKPDYITFHVESNDDIKECINLIKENNIKVGIALSPNTRIYNIIPYLKDIDLVLVMSVEPGYGGQEFIKSSINKINELKAIQKKYNYIINVDGGINDRTIKDINSDMIVSGSFITMSDNYDENILKLKG